MATILILLATSTRGLLRDRPAVALTFALPLLFFTVFAAVFGSLDQAVPKALDVDLEVADSGTFSAAFVESLREDPMLRVTPVANSAATAERLASGKTDAYVRVPGGFDARIEDGQTAVLEVLTDGSNPLVGPAVSGALLGVLLTTGADFSDDLAPTGGEPFRIDLSDGIGRGDSQPSTAFFAAGLGVLFLMISLTNRAGMILEDRENGTLERLLSTRVTLPTYLLGRALFPFCSVWSRSRRCSGGPHSCSTCRFTNISAAMP
ncbi:MAG: ABC transporter permease [Pseudomonadota bacterium]